MEKHLAIIERASGRSPSQGLVGELSPACLGPLAGVSLRTPSQAAHPRAQDTRRAGRAAEGSFRGCCTRPRNISGSCKTQQVWRADEPASSSDASCLLCNGWCTFAHPLLQVGRTSDCLPPGSRHCSAQACLKCRSNSPQHLLSYELN